jgi:hypothetical protein
MFFEVLNYFNRNPAFAIMLVILAAMLSIIFYLVGIQSGFFGM